jgi:tetratricopeptide (TPR) repeat protein
MQSDTVDRRLQAYTNLVEAVKLDPGFVDAYYAMFEVYFDSYVGEKLPPHYDELANFRDVMEKLRRVAPNSAQYHAAKSTVEFEEWHFDEAIGEAALAIESNPKFLRAHSNYGSYVCLTRGDAVTALRELGIAEQIDPNDQYVRIDKAIAFSVARRFDLAVKQFLHLLDLEPRTTQLHLNLGDAYESDRQYEKALDEYEKFDLLNGRDPVQTKAWYQKLRAALREKGPRGWWQAELDGVVSNPSLDPPYPYRMAKINARLNNTNEVFRLLNQAYNSRDDGMEFLLSDDCFDFVHGDPRFQQLVKKMDFRPKFGAVH